MWLKWTVNFFIIVLLRGTDSFSLENNYYTAEITEILNEVLRRYENESIEISNPDCVAQIRAFLSNLGNSTGDDIWALRMIDAAPKMPSGMLELNLGMIGRYEECLNIKSQSTGVKGKYCLASIIVPSEIGNPQSKMPKLPPETRYSYNLLHKIRPSYGDIVIPDIPAFGMCIPDQCTEEDVHQTFLSILAIIPWSVTCQTEETLHPPLGIGAILTLSYFGIFVLLMALSTGYDLMTPNKDDKPPPNRLLFAFSIRTNGKKLFRVSRGDDELSAVHGIRFFSMVWVLYGHVFLATIYGPLSNTIDVLKLIGKTESMIIGNATYAVDTFFLLSGLLVVYGFLKVTRMIKFSLFHYYFHRYLRLVPPLVPVILTTIYLVPYLGSGPFYPALESAIVKPCRLRWWKDLFLIQNYAADGEICVKQTWYLGADWQLYSIAPIFLLFLSKRPKINLSILSVGLMASMISAGIMTWKYELSASLTNLYGKVLDSAIYFYYQTYAHASSWIIGAFLGYLLAKIQLDNSLAHLKLPKWLVLFAWGVVLTAIPICIFAGNKSLISPTYHPYSNLLFNIFAGPAWCLCISWIIFACAVDYGGIINSILSWPLFRTLNRFTYSMYLIHLNMFDVISFSQKFPGYLSMFNLAYNFWGAFALTFFVSIFWVLAFESPVIVFQKYLLEERMKIVRSDRKFSNNGGLNAIQLQV